MTNRERLFDHANISMTHDELVKLLGDAYKQIEDAGFVLVPRTWRDSVMEKLNRRTSDD